MQPTICRGEDSGRRLGWVFEAGRRVWRVLLLDVWFTPKLWGHREYFWSFWRVVKAVCQEVRILDPRLAQVSVAKRA
jgi:hypothetical protein